MMRHARSARRGSPLQRQFLAVLGGMLAAAMAISIAGCSGRSARSPGEGGAGDEGTGPQILTSDLLARQEVNTERITVNWAVIGNAPIRSILINGEPEDFKPSDTVTVSREVLLRKAQTLLTVVAIDTRNEKRERDYVIVNPALPERDPDETSLTADKLPRGRRDQARASREIKEREATYKSKFAESEYSPWMFEGPLDLAYKDAVAAGRYPVWIEGRSLGVSFHHQFRMVFKSQPRDIEDHKAYWNLTVDQYNALMDQLTATGYEQLARDVLMSSNDQWRVQTVWRLKAKKK